MQPAAPSGQTRLIVLETMIGCFCRLVSFFTTETRRHGIGQEMHEWPQILCYGSKNEGPKLKSGMTICIESLCCTGNDDVQNLNLWETKMRDGGLFAQFEHTVLVLDKWYEILTK